VLDVRPQQLKPVGHVAEKIQALGDLRRLRLHMQRVRADLLMRK
jgi:hypothetical protein